MGWSGEVAWCPALKFVCNALANKYISRAARFWLHERINTS